MNLLHVLLPELILIIAASVLFLVGMCPAAAARKFAPFIALAALAIVFVMQMGNNPGDNAVVDSLGTVRIVQMGIYIRMLAAGVGMLFVLLSWPSDREGTGNSALNYNTE